MSSLRFFLLKICQKCQKVHGRMLLGGPLKSKKSAINLTLAHVLEQIVMFAEIFSSFGHNSGESSGSNVWKK